MSSNLLCTGAAREVTGSGHFLTTPSGRVLLDCGLFQGHRRESDEKNRRFLFNPRDIDVVVVSHAHLDHIGRLPLLLRGGFRGRIISTRATRDLAELILLDSAKIQVQDAEFAKKHHLPDAELHQPLYTPEDIPAVMARFDTVEYNSHGGKGIELPGGLAIHLYDAGHILGSSTIHLSWEEAGHRRGLVFTGDLGRNNAPLLNDPDPVTQPAETLVMEATYGTRRHHAVDEVYGQLVGIVAEAIERQSVIVVPAFSLGRTQELLYILHRLIDDHKIPALPIIVDSPLAERINTVFINHQSEYDAQTKIDFPRRGDMPLRFHAMRFTHTVDESKSLNSLGGPMIIISASGMASGGRVMHHLKQRLPDPNTIVLFTGYQAIHTPGRRLIEGAEYLRVFGQEIPVRAKIKILNDLSAHADAEELAAFPRPIPGLKRVVLVHAEPDRSTGFADVLRQRYPGLEVIIPGPGDSIPLE